MHNKESLLEISLKIREVIDLVLQIHGEPEYKTLGEYLINFYMNHLPEHSSDVAELFSIIARFEEIRDRRKSKFDSPH